MKTTLRLTLLLTLLLATGCSTRNPWHDPAQPHRGEDGFHNTAEDIHPSLPGLLKRLFLRLFEAPVAHDASRVPRVMPKLATLQSPTVPHQATWLGHATVLLQMDGLNVITDPQFSERASPVSWAGPKRQTPVPVPPAQLPRIDVVVVSHDHFDHFDLPSLRQLAAQPGGEPLFLVPLGNAALLREVGITRVVELDWWQTHAVGRAEFTLVPVQHWSHRSLLEPRNQRLWGGYVIASGGRKAFFAGDTGYSPDFREIARRFHGIDFAMLPIGAYQPRDFVRPQHIDPDEAVTIHRELGSRLSMGIHWGTFILTLEPIQQPPLDLARALAAQDVDPASFPVWALGETRPVP